MILTTVATHSYAKEVSSNRASCQNLSKFQKQSHHVPQSAENLVVVVPKASKIMGLQHGNPDPGDSSDNNLMYTARRCHPLHLWGTGGERQTSTCCCDGGSAWGCSSFYGGSVGVELWPFFFFQGIEHISKI